MQLYSLYEAKKKEWLPAPPETIDKLNSYIKEYDLSNFVQIQNNDLVIFGFNLPLLYNDGIPHRTLLAAFNGISKFIQSITSKVFTKYGKNDNTKLKSIIDLLYMVAMPKDKLRSISLTVHNGSRSFWQNVIDGVKTYNRFNNDPYIEQLPINLIAILNSTKADVDNANDDANTVFSIIKDLNTQSKRVDILNKYTEYLVKYRGVEHGDVVDFMGFKFNNTGLNIFIKIKLGRIGGGGGYFEHQLRKAVAQAAFLQQINNKTAQHAESLPSIAYLINYFSQSIPAHPNHKFNANECNAILDWALVNFNDISHNKRDELLRMLIDTINMALTQRQPFGFLNGNLETMKIQHDQLMEIKLVSQNVDFDNDILPIKEFYPDKEPVLNLKLEYIKNSVELVKEGQKMHHCVGSYVDSVKSGMNAIYRIIWNNRHVGTLSLISDDYGVVTTQNARVQQAYGPTNKHLPNVIRQQIDRLLKRNRNPDKFKEPDAPIKEFISRLDYILLN